MDGNPAFFMEMRLGKTLVAVRWAASYEGPHLVVCPKHAFEDWCRELVLENKKPIVLEGSSAKKYEWLSEHWDTLSENWVLINPETITAMPRLLDFEWGCLLLDESQCIRKPKTNLTRIMVGQTKHIPHKCCMSGTHDPEGIQDVFMQMVFLHGEFMGCSNFWQWRSRYFFPVGYGWLPKKGVKEEVALLLSQKCFILKYTDAGVRMPTVKVKHVIDMPSKLKKEYRKVEKEFALGDKETVYAIVVHNWLARLCGGFAEEVKQSDHKAKALEEILAGEFKRDKVVVFFRFNLEIDGVADYLKSRTKRNVRILKGGNVSTRNTTIAQFKATKKNDVLLAQSKVCRHAIDLSTARAAIFFSNWWDHEIRQQCAARILHPSKDSKAYILDICVDKSVDLDATVALQKKSSTRKQLYRSIQKLAKKRYAT